MTFDRGFGSPIIYYSVLDEQIKMETFVIAGGYGALEHKNIDSSSVIVTDETGDMVYILGLDYSMDYENGMIIALENGGLVEMGTFVASFKYYPIMNSSSTAGETNNPIFDGMKVFIYNEPIAVDFDSSGWISSTSPHCYRIFDQRIRDYLGWRSW